MKSQLPRQISIKKVIQVPTTLLYVTSNLQFFRPCVRLFKCSEMLSSAQNFDACHYGTIIGQQTNQFPTVVTRKWWNMKFVSSGV